MNLTRVHRLRADPESHRWLTVIDPADWKRLEVLRAAATTTHAWEPLLVEDLIESAADLARTRCDFPVFGSVPAFSERAVEALLDILVPFGELLPLTGAPYSVYNVTKLLDVLDEANSTLVRFSSGRIMKIERYALHAAGLDGSPIFKLPQYRRVDVFVTEAFVQKVAAAGLTGFAFEAVWPHSALGAA